MLRKSSRTENRRNCFEKEKTPKGNHPVQKRSFPDKTAVLSARGQNLLQTQIENKNIIKLPEVGITRSLLECFPKCLDEAILHENKQNISFIK